MATASFATYGDLLEEIVRLREAGRLEEALALMEREGRAFPDQTAFVHLWRMSLAVGLGRVDHALEAFAEAVAAGCRYPEPMIHDWPAIGPLHDVVEFERLAHIAALRYDAELGSSHPHVIVERPDAVAPVQGLPLLVVLHGNNSTAERTMPDWRSATERGWAVAAIGSAEIALTPGLFVWNDGERAQRDVVAGTERLVREQRIDPRRIVLAGYSAGALRALQLAYGGALGARGAIAVAPWLPPAEIDALTAAKHVPTFIAVGDRDRGGYDGSRALADHLRAANVPVRLEAISGHGHGYPTDMPRILADAIELILTG
ncbi:MAG: dienelactone hydrolase family protein [Chloroflexi bacterium]|nr:dienelactone hydrolase family protein [Chloroflexota bacterium]